MRKFSSRRVRERGRRRKPTSEVFAVFEGARHQAYLPTSPSVKSSQQADFVLIEKAFPYGLREYTVTSLVKGELVQFDNSRWWVDVLSHKHYERLAQEVERRTRRRNLVIEVRYR